MSEKSHTSSTSSSNATQQATANPIRHHQTGPKSQAGKAKASQNAIKHGLRAKKLLTSFEDPREYDAHAERIFRALDPQDCIEEEIVHAYAYAIWSSPRGERYLQANSGKYSSVDEEDIAKALGIKRDLRPFVPTYVCKMDYEISPERAAQGEYLHQRFKELEKEIKDSDLKEWDLQKTAKIYQELFDQFHQWSNEPLYCNSNRDIHEKWTKDPNGFWKQLEGLACHLYFEANFMRLKPQIRVIYENEFWKSATNSHFAQGFSGHFQKTQDFAFKQLQRLYAYRGLKQQDEKKGVWIYAIARRWI